MGFLSGLEVEDNVFYADNYGNIHRTSLTTGTLLTIAGWHDQNLNGAVFNLCIQ
jgi:hypothetical protein